jgi:hypothetical protein
MHLHDILRNGSDVTKLYFNARYKSKMKNSVENVFKKMMRRIAENQLGFSMFACQ